MKHGARGATIVWFPGEGTVVHGDECAILSDQTANDYALVHEGAETVGVLVLFPDP